MTPYGYLFVAEEKGFNFMVSLQEIKEWALK